MAKYNDAKCRLCRREGTKLLLKGDRCFTDKCAFDRRPYAPGQHGRARKKLSDYAVQLREKQKVRRVYGVLEKQFHSYFVRADMAKGVTGANLLAFLERRLDNVVYRLGFANSRVQARQLVRHGVFTLNGHKVTIPSLQVKVGDSVEVPEKSRTIPVLAEAQEAVDKAHAAMKTFDEKGSKEAASQAAKKKKVSPSEPKDFGVSSLLSADLRRLQHIKLDFSTLREIAP